MVFGYKNSGSQWSVKEVFFLRSNYRNASDKSISSALGRTEASIKTKRRDLSMIKTKCERNLTRSRGVSYITLPCSSCGFPVMKEIWDARRSKDNYCSKSCRSKGQSKLRGMENHHNWKGGRYKTSDGYRVIKCRDHPFSDSQGYVKEHRLVVEEKMGRYLTKEEVVHHIDFNRSNNNIVNLMLFPTSKAHMKFHTKLKQFGETGPIRRQIEQRWHVPLK